MTEARTVKTEADMRALLNELRAHANGHPRVKVQGPDGLEHLIEARRWLSANRRENPARYFIDRRRASVDTIVGVVIYDAGTLAVNGNRLMLSEPSLRDAINKSGIRD